MRVTFYPPSPQDFKLLLSGDPDSVLRQANRKYGSGLEDIAIFSSPRGYRRGAGIFSTLTKTVIPFLFRNIKPVAKKFGSQVAKDVLFNRENIKSSLKKRGLEAIAETGQRLFQGTSPPKNKRRKTKVKKGGGHRSQIKRKRTSKKNQTKNKKTKNSTKRKKRKPWGRTKSIKDVYSLLS